MPTTFSRSVRSLAADRFRGSAIAIGCAVALLVGWGAWFFFSRVGVYAVSGATRLEVDEAVHPVEAPVSGRVVSTRLALGLEVQAGEVLVELDSESEQLQLEEERARLEALSSELEMAGRELGSQEKVLTEARRASSAALAEAEARSRQAKALESYTKEKAARWNELHSGGIVTGVDLLEATADARQTEEAADAIRLGVDRLRQDRRIQETSQVAMLDGLRREVTHLTGAIATGHVTIERLEHEIARRRITAPIDGTLGEVTTLRLGSVVEQGEELASVVPSGDVKAVAYFLPAEACGRIRAKQRARIRLDGFPWTQFGTVPAVVTRVGTEPQQAGLRVELSVDRAGSRMPLEHGLPGTAEVEVERVSPWTLVLRAAGKLLAPVGTQQTTGSPDDRRAEAPR